jgi:polyketide biosynthesis enoyl-CoA hydratase PksH
VPQVVAVRRERTFVRATLARPDAGNALRPDLIAGVNAAIDLAEREPACRALVLDSSSDRFCVGLDLDAATGSGEGHGGGGAFRRLLARLSGTPVVTVAVVDGATIGGGVGVAAACDLVVAGDGATFRLTEVLLGLLPGMMMPPLARRVGEQSAYRLAALADEIGAAEAVRLGLADLHTPRAVDGLRQVLVSLGRTDRATLSELKALRRWLFRPAPEDYGQYAGKLLRRRLDDPAVRLRIDRLRDEGILR